MAEAVDPARLKAGTVLLTGDGKEGGALALSMISATRCGACDRARRTASLVKPASADIKGLRDCVSMSQNIGHRSATYSP